MALRNHFRDYDLVGPPLEVLLAAAHHDLRVVAVRRHVHRAQRLHVRTQLQLLEGVQRGRLLRLPVMISTKSEL